VPRHSLSVACSREGSHAQCEEHDRHGWAADRVREEQCVPCVCCTVRLHTQTIHAYMSDFTLLYRYFWPVNCAIVFHLLAIVICSPYDFISSYSIPIPVIIPLLTIITDPRVGPSWALYRRKPANLFTRRL
jgi:hypothetical protein